MFLSCGGVPGCRAVVGQGCGDVLKSGVLHECGNLQVIGSSIAVFY